MDVAYLKRVGLGFLSIVLVLCIFVYVVFHLTNGFSPEIITTPALRGQYLERDDSQGYIFRYESVVSKLDGGTVNYNVSDGEKIGIGTLVATVYENVGDEKLTAQMVDIDRRIELLSRSNILDNVSVSDTKTEDEKIGGYLDTIMQSKRAGNYTAASNLSGDLLVAMNRRELIVSSRTSYDKEIAALRTERASISSALSGKSEAVYVNKSGYFYYECDGYERLFDPESLESMTPESLDALVSATPDSTGYVGKNVTLQKWYLALKLDRTELGKYTLGESYKIAFRDYSDITVTMKLERLNVSADEGLLVFSSNDMPEGFAFERSQSVSVITEEHEGLRFPASALRLCDGVEGVYVLYGNTVFFRAAEVIAKENGYAYVKADGDEYVVIEGDESGEGRVAWQSVALYDEVIVGGTGLYHSMIVN